MDFISPQFVKSFTFDDILMIPQFSDIQSRSECLVDTMFSRRIPLKVPIVSSPMDSVTEEVMAIEMARNGGIGVLHRYNTIEDQVQMVKRVKRAENFLVEAPYLIDENESIDRLNELRQELKVSSFLVTNLSLLKKEDEDKSSKTKNISGVFSLKDLNLVSHLPLNGIITRRDLKAQKSSSQIVKDLMTPREKLKVFVKPEDIKLEQIDLEMLYEDMMNQRLEKIPIVDVKNQIVGMACEKDLARIKTFSRSNINQRGKLFVSAAIGCRGDYLERAQQLVSNDCDCLIVDVANGHNK